MNLIADNNCRHMSQLNACDCGAQPTIEKISEWPAQYRVACICGVAVRGYYYGSDDKEFRHRAAQASAIEQWNHAHPIETGAGATPLFAGMKAA